MSEIAKVENVIGKKGADVFSIRPDAKVREAAEIMSERRIGVLVVTGVKGQAIGMLSERDIVRVVSDEKMTGIRDIPVRKLMTRDIVSCKPSDSLLEILRLMGENAFRHMPVVRRGQVIGLLSVTDILNYLKDETADADDDVLWSRIATPQRERGGETEG